MDRILFIAGAIVAVAAVSFVDIKHALHTFQQNRYECFRYRKWLKQQQIDREDVILYILKSLPWVVLFFLKMPLFYPALLGLSAIVFVLSYKAENKKNYIKPLHVTDRVKRQILTMVLLYVILFGLLFYLLPMFIWPVCFIIAPLLAWFFIFMMFYINEPIEKTVREYFLNQARKILKESPFLTKIGITGSYGKTSTKNIVQAVLSGKYYSLMTPASFNTPMGITITVREHLKPLHEVFVCEMGADKVGEIDYLTKFVQPKYGIVTSIGPQHLNTFINLENIITEKMKMIENLPADGVGFINLDNEYIKNYKIQNRCKIITYSLSDSSADYYATDIQYHPYGSEFTIVHHNESYSFKTKLLGAHNVMNILVSVALGREMSVSWKELQEAVMKIEKIEHRLELKKINGYTFIDNAFNSNPEGSAMSLNVLSMMPNKRFIVTPGMIDLGEKQEEANYHFGSLMKDKADVVILVGPKQTKPIYDGLRDSGYEMSDVHVVQNVKEAFSLVYQLATTEDTILLENDLPDAFNQ